MNKGQIYVKIPIGIFDNSQAIYRRDNMNEIGVRAVCLGLRVSRPDGTFVLSYLHPAMNRRAIVTDAVPWGIRIGLS